MSEIFQVESGSKKQNKNARIEVVAIASAAIEPRQVTSSNDITATAAGAIELRAFLSSACNVVKLETDDRCRTTSSTEFHQTLFFPSSVGKGFACETTSHWGSLHVVLVGFEVGAISIGNEMGESAISMLFHVNQCNFK